MPKKSRIGRLNNAPLVYVLAQVRHSPILATEKYVSDIQEQVRKQYPLFKKTVTQTLAIGGPGQQPDVSEVTRWEFANKEKNTGFILQKDSFVFHTTAYETFGSFLDLFRSALAAVNKYLDISLVQRIGLRYVDAIETDVSDKLRLYLVSGLAGFPTEEFGLNQLISYTESISQTEIGQLIMKVTQKTDGRTLPPELSPVGLEIPRTLDNSRPSALLDFDHFSENQIDFDIETVVATLTKLQGVSAEAFRETVTEYAIDKWK